MVSSDVTVALGTYLEGPFEPSELSSGLYTGASDSEAYGLLRSMVLSGAAELAGERFLPDGRKAVTARVMGGGRRKNPVEDEGEAYEIKLGPEFFVKVKNDYESWPVKWWREVVQNAVDAGAKNVGLGVEALGNGLNRVWCQDDGGGMSKEILVEKFLKLGATTKVGGEGMAGGFGRAKELILLPWVSWRVVTQDWEAVGAGASYRVKRLPSPSKGTLIEAYMSDAERTHSYAAMEFLQRSYLPKTKFTVDGEPFKRELKMTKVIRELPGKAIFYAVPSDGHNYAMYVRANGLYMFDRYLTKKANAVVVVELLGPSIKLMTSNRDGISDRGLKEEIDEFANLIAADVTSALKSKQGIVTKIYRGTGQFAVKERTAEAVAATAHITTAAEMKKAPEEIFKLINYMEKMDAEREEEEGPREVPVGRATAKSVETLLSVAPTDPLMLESILKQLVWEPDYYLTNEIEGFHVPKPFFPATMTPRVLRLLKVWTELCRFVLIQLGSSTQYGVGFVFSNTAGAMAAMGATDKWLLVNPFKAHGMTSGRYDYRVVVSYGKSERRLLAPGKDEDLRWLYALAIHECTHVADGVDTHNEAFSSAMTMNMARCASGWGKIKKLVEGIKMRGGLAADVSGKGSRRAEAADEEGEDETFEAPEPGDEE